MGNETASPKDGGEISHASDTASHDAGATVDPTASVEIVVLPSAADHDLPTTRCGICAGAIVADYVGWTHIDLYGMNAGWVCPPPHMAIANPEPATPRSTGSQRAVSRVPAPRTMAADDPELTAVITVTPADAS